MFSLPMTIGMVIFTLIYFSGPDVPKYVFFTVAYTWFCSLSIIILVPADIWTVFPNQFILITTFFPFSFAPFVLSMCYMLFIKFVLLRETNHWRNRMKLQNQVLSFMVISFILFLYLNDCNLVMSFPFIDQTLNGDQNGEISVFWSLSYWSTFLLTW